MAELPDDITDLDPGDFECAVAKLRCRGPQEAIWDAMVEFEAWVDGFDGVEGGRAPYQPWGEDGCLIVYTLESSRAGRVPPALDQLRAIFKAAQDAGTLRAWIAVPGYQLVFYGYEKIYAGWTP